MYSKAPAASPCVPATPVAPRYPVAPVAPQFPVAPVAPLPCIPVAPWTPPSKYIISNIEFSSNPGNTTIVSPFTIV